MSLETLLEAAKYVEYQTQAKARGEEPHDYHTFSKLCSASKDGQYSSSEVPKRQHTFSNSSQSSEDVKEKRRSAGTPYSKDSPLSHEHSGTGTREVHNKLEKNRRAHLKECFEALKKQLPNMDDRKTSNLSILRGAIRFIQILKRKERDYEHDMERLAREKIAFQQRLSILKKDLSSQMDHVDVKPFIAEDDNETTTTASECGNLSDFDDNLPTEGPVLSASTSDFASSSSSSTASSVLVGPVSSTSAALTAAAKPSVSGAHLPAPIKESPASYIKQETPEDVKPPAPPMVPPVQAQHTDATSTQTARVFSTNNLHTMAGIFAPHAMQVITQPSGIKVITAPPMVSLNPQHPHGQIHVLAPSSTPSPYISPGKTYCAESSLVQVAPSTTAKGLARPHLVSPLALVSPQTMVELSQGNSGKGTHLGDLIGPGSLNLSQKAGSMAIAMKNNGGVTTAGGQPGMIATLHVTKPSSQIMQPSMGHGIITQGGSHINNGTHSGVSSGLKPIVSNRSLPHITGIAHVVSQPTPVAQLVSHTNHVSPLVGSVSVVSHTGAVHPQPMGKGGILAGAPVLKSVGGALNPIPILQPQHFLQQVGSTVKPVVVVSMASVAPGSGAQLEPAGIVRGGTANHK